MIIIFLQRLEFVHDKYCELKASLGLTQPSSGADGVNPFPEMRNKIRSVPVDRTGSNSGPNLMTQGTLEEEEEDIGATDAVP